MKTKSNIYDLNSGRALVPESYFTTDRGAGYDLRQPLVGRTVRPRQKPGSFFAALKKSFLLQVLMLVPLGLIIGLFSALFPAVGKVINDLFLSATGWFLLVIPGLVVMAVFSRLFAPRR